MIRWFMVPSCGEVVRVRSVTSNAVWGGPRDETALVDAGLRVGGDRGVLLLPCSSRLRRGWRSTATRGTSSAPTRSGRGARGTVLAKTGMVPYVVRNPYVGELADFAAAVREGRAPAVDAREGLRNVELLEEMK